MINGENHSVFKALIAYEAIFKDEGLFHQINFLHLAHHEGVQLLKIGV